MYMTNTMVSTPANFNYQPLQKEFFFSLFFSLIIENMNAAFNVEKETRLE
jgi:hypothetical protein